MDYKRFGYGKSEFESETESVWVELHYGNVLGNTVQLNPQVSDHVTMELY